MRAGRAWLEPIVIGVTLMVSSAMSPSRIALATGDASTAGQTVMAGETEVPSDAQVLPDGSRKWTGDDGTVYIKQPDGDASEKVRMPVLEKLVYDEDVESWGATCDAGQSERVSFRLVGTLPATLSDYDSYSYEFTDRLPDGMDAERASIRVRRCTSGTTIDSGDDVTSTMTISLDGGTLTVGTEDILSAIPSVTSDDRIVVEYEAWPTKDALSGIAKTNDNFAKLTHPTADGKGKTSTPERKASVITYRIAIHKFEEGTSKPLGGAGFLVSDMSGAFLADDGTWGSRSSAATFTTDGAGQVTLPLMDSGIYKLEEVVAPTGYGVTGPFDLSVSIDGRWDNPSLSVSVTSGTSVTADAGTGIIDIFVSDPAGTGSPSGYGSDASRPNGRGDASPFGQTVLPQLGTFLVKWWVPMALVAGGVVLLAIRRQRSRA